MHDINADPAKNNSKGIYLENPSADIVVENNLCYDISVFGMHASGERNQIRNNIFALCGMAGLSRGTPKGIPDKANHFTRNIVYPIMKHLFLIFGNDGLTWNCAYFKADPAHQGVELYAKGGDVKLVSLEVWPLNSIWK